MRILLIEDDPMLGKALVRGLSDHGVTVDWARDGAEGSAALAHDEHAWCCSTSDCPNDRGSTF